MKILNTSYSEFFNATKKAFVGANISPIKRDSVVRRFLNHQLFPDQNMGENESRLKELFVDDKKEEVRESNGTVILLEHYENNEYGNVLVDVDTYICISKEAVNKKLAKLFSENYPDFDGERLLESSTVTNAIRSMALVTVLDSNSLSPSKSG